MAAKPSGNKSVLVIGLGRFGGSVAGNYLDYIEIDGPYTVVKIHTPYTRWVAASRTCRCTTNTA